MLQLEKRILLVNPIYPRKVAGIPLQLLYLAGAVRDVASVKILDLDREEKPFDKLLHELEDYKPDFVGVTSYSPNYPESLDIMSTVRSNSPNAKIISGGPHEIASGIHEKNKSIDYKVVSTFGENDLLTIIGSKKRLTNRQTIFPAYDLLEQNPGYQFDGELFSGRKNTQYFTATGCESKCSFCSAQQQYSTIDMSIVTDHLGRLIDIGYTGVFFNDPNFTNPVQSPDKYSRTKELMKALRESGISQELIWGCQTKASMVNQELLDHMADAGCKYICYALENVDASLLRDMSKFITPQIIKGAVGISKEHGIKTGLYVMLGTLPSRERDMLNVEKTLDFVEELKPDYLSISILAYYPMFDRSNPFIRQHTDLDYANKQYSREGIWTYFDEGWGAYHPYCDANYAAKIKSCIEGRKQKNPQIWKAIRRF